MKTNKERKFSSWLRFTQFHALLAALLLLGATAMQVSAAPADVDLSFDPGIINDPHGSGLQVVLAIALQADGKVLIGGYFATVAGTVRVGLARLNEDGSLDSAFAPELAPGYPQVDGLAIRTDGKILIRGSFTSVNGVGRTNLALLNADGTLDNSFETSLGAPAPWSGRVSSFALQSDNKVLIGGDFTSVNGVAKTNLARLNADGSLDPAFNAPRGGGSALALQSDGKILVAGQFTTINGVSKLARLNADGSLDASFVPAATPEQYSVQCIALQSDGKIVLGGEWSSPTELLVYVSRLKADGSVDASFNCVPFGYASTFRALVVQPNGKILYGCVFRGGPSQTPPFVGRLNSEGSPDSSFVPDRRVSPFAIALQADGKIVVARNFAAINETPRICVARLMGDYAPLAIVTSPASQTAEVGATVQFAASVTGYPPPSIHWFFNTTNLLASGTNSDFVLTNVQPAQSGAYVLVASNGVWPAVTSAPAMLNVIPPVERRPVPGVLATAEIGSALNVDCTDALGLAANWWTLDTLSMTGTSRWCFDVSAPLPTQRFYRASAVGASSVLPSLNLHLIPALTLMGDVGSQARVDGINQVGPIDAWFTLATVTLTNTSQLYFDVSAVGQPARLYRLVPLP